MHLTPIKPDDLIEVEGSYIARVLDPPANRRVRVQPVGRSALAAREVKATQVTKHYKLTGRPRGQKG